VKLGDFIALIPFLLVGLVGGVAKELSLMGKRVFRWRTFLKNLFIAVFAALLIAFLGKHFKWDGYLISFGAAMLGFAGREGIDFFWDLVKSRAKGESE